MGGYQQEIARSKRDQLSPPLPELSRAPERVGRGQEEQASEAIRKVSLWKGATTLDIELRLSLK